MYLAVRQKLIFLIGGRSHFPNKNVKTYTLNHSRFNPSIGIAANELTGVPY